MQTIIRNIHTAGSDVSTSLGTLSANKLRQPKHAIRRPTLRILQRTHRENSHTNTDWHAISTVEISISFTPPFWPQKCQNK